MYSLLGFIQILMITQSRLMPDLSGLFEDKAPVTATVSKFPTPITGQVRTVNVYWQALESIRRRRNVENWKTPVYTIENFSLRASGKKQLTGNRIINADKLYLVFCQWKTEG